MNHHICPCQLIVVGKYFTTTEKCANCGGEGKKGKRVVMEVENEIGKEIERQAAEKGIENGAVKGA